MTGGVAWPAEAPGDLEEMIKVVRAGLERTARSKEARMPFGLNDGMLAAVLTLLCAEWILRKRWNLS